MIEDNQHVPAFLREKLDAAGVAYDPTLARKRSDDIDPWAHRASRMRCETCMWFAPKQRPAGLSNGPVFGRCRRHAPTMSGYPAVYGIDWCGDYKLDEAKA